MAKKNSKVTAKKVKKSNNNVKKNNVVKETKKDNNVSNNELINLLKIVLIVCGVLLAFYFATVLIHDDNNETENDTVSDIQYEKILVGEILNRSNDEYYVLVEKENDSYIDLYKQYLTMNDDVAYYTVDLSDIFNKSNIGEETKVEGNDVSQYRFSGTTLLKVKNGSLVETYVSREDIISCLENLIK